MFTKDCYNAAVADLKKFCEEETNFTVEVIEDCYPLEVRFKPSISQLSFFKDDYTDKNGEVGHISVFGGIEPTVKINLKVTIGNSLLKKNDKQSGSCDKIIPALQVGRSCEKGKGLG